MHEFKIVRERRSGYGLLKRFRSSADVYESFKEHFDKLDREHFVVLLLDAKNGMLGFNTVSIGSLTSSLVHPREAFKPVVLHNDAVKERYKNTSHQRDLRAEYPLFGGRHDPDAQPPVRRPRPVPGRPAHYQTSARGRGGVRRAGARSPYFW